MAAGQEQAILHEIYWSCCILERVTAVFMKDEVPPKFELPSHALHRLEDNASG